ncbi:hypothetical protein AK812_SmicGene44931, partial [Symbiodinium microadriaticum]
MAKRLLPRRSGLSVEEKQCMGRAPLFSEAFLLQAQHRRWRKESDVHSPAAAKAHKVSGVTALASRRTVQVASTPINRECSKGAEARPKPAMVSEAKRLALLRKDRAWNSKQFPLRKNCIELVRGALAT